MNADRCRWTVTGLIVAALLSVAPAAHADSSTATNAPLVTPGQEVFGNSTNDNVYYGDTVSYWGLSVIAGDRVSIAYSLPSEEAPGFHLFVEPAGATGVFGTVGIVESAIAESTTERASATVRYEAPVTGVEPLAFDFDYAGPYTFTVTVLHRVDLQLPPLTRVARRGTVRVNAHDPDGKPLTVPGLGIALQYEVSRHHWRTIGSAHPRHGIAHVAYRLPASAAGHRLQLRARATGGGYYTLVSRSRRVRVR